MLTRNSSQKPTKAWDDGIITEEELAELKQFQSALGISDEEAEDISKKAKKASSEE